MALHEIRSTLEEHLLPTLIGPEPPWSGQEGYEALVTKRLLQSLVRADELARQALPTNERDEVVGNLEYALALWKLDRATILETPPESWPSSAV